MKYQTFLVILFSLFYQVLFSQSCLPEGITFETQAQIDDFQSDYPGCTIILGDLEIIGTDISDLSGLDVIDSIYGNFIIGDEWSSSNSNLLTLNGLENLSFIGGDLEIIKNTNLFSISGLAGISNILGDLRIKDNPDLTSLAGLDNLDDFYGALIIGNNNLLLNLTGLEKLEHIEYFACHGNQGLTNLEGLNNLITINGSLALGDNPSMPSLAGLDNLSYTGGIYLESTSLFSFAGLESLDSAGTIQLYDNEYITSLEGLSDLKSITYGLQIENNALLNSFDGLEELNTIGGGLIIVNNNSLTSIESLTDVNADSLDDLWICNNPNLTGCDIQIICDYLAAPTDMIMIYNNGAGCDSPPEIAENCGFTMSCLPFGSYFFLLQSDIDGFPSDYSNCSQLNGYVRIMGDNISNLDSLAGIETINGTLSICANDNLTSLHGLHNLRTIEENLYLGWYEYPGNNSLTNLEGLNSLAFVGEDMLVIYNDGLLNLSGLDSLSEIGGRLSVHYNISLKNLQGLENLTSAGSVYISENNSLVSLNGFQNLINISGDLYVTDNPELFSIDGIENIDADNLTGLGIYNNDILSNCDVKSVCDYLANPGGDIIIFDNDSNCNSLEEVELACSVGVGESAVGGRRSAVVCYPNPVFDQVIFEFNLQVQCEVDLSVFNNMGQMVATIQDGSLEKGDHQLIWNASRFPVGIYFYRFRNGNYSSTGKLVKLKND
jgi:hypothetical protein